MYDNRNRRGSSFRNSSKHERCVCSNGPRRSAGLRISCRYTRSRSNRSNGPCKYLRKSHSDSSRGNLQRLRDSKCHRGDRYHSGSSYAELELHGACLRISERLTRSLSSECDWDRNNCRYTQHNTRERFDSFVRNRRRRRFGQYITRFYNLISNLHDTGRRIAYHNLRGGGM